MNIDFQAFERSKAFAKIFNISADVLGHCSSIYYDKNSESLSHWKDEVANKLSSITDLTLKEGNKKISMNDYYECLWENEYDDVNDLDTIDSLKKVIKSRSKHEGKTYNIKNETLLYDFAKRYREFVIKCSYEFSLKSVKRDTIRGWIDKYFFESDLPSRPNLKFTIKSNY